MSEEQLNYSSGWPDDKPLDRRVEILEDERIHMLGRLQATEEELRQLQEQTRTLQALVGQIDGEVWGILQRSIALRSHTTTS